MTGDLFLWIKRVLQQHFICNHDYKPDRIGIITGLNSRRIYKKCNKFED